MARKIMVEITGDSRSLERAFARSSRSAATFTGNISKSASQTRRTFAGLAGLVGGVSLAATIKSSVTAASDLEQQMGKTEVVFGESAAAVEAWSEGLATAFGLSQREALTTASTFGALFAPIGLTGQAAAEQSQKLTELGADLASFYNTDVASALDALRSGLVGESEPLRKYGVLLSETRVQQEALNQTGKRTASSLTAQEKVLARLSLIFKDSKLAQGDFGRTSKQAAQQTKILQANLENLKATLGTALIPVLNDTVTALNEFFTALSGGEQEGPVTGQRVETTLVPLLAKRIAAYKKAGVSSKEILRLLRKQLGDETRESTEVRRLRKLGLIRGKEEVEHSGKVSDLIAEAFQFSRDAKLRKRIREQAKGAREDPTAAAGDGLTKAQLRKRTAGLRAAREALRQEIVDRAAFAVDRAGLTKTLADDLAALQKLQALLRRRIRGGHDTLQLEQQLLGVQQQTADIVRQQAEQRAAARQARQFRLLGFGPTGGELIPGVRALQKQLNNVRDSIAGSFLDTRKTRGLLGHIRQVLSGGLGSVSAEVRSKVQQILADLKGQLRQSSVDVTRFQKTARGQFALAGASAGPRALVVTGGLHLHGVQNVQQLENELARRAKQRAHARRSTR